MPSAWYTVSPSVIEPFSGNDSCHTTDAVSFLRAVAAGSFNRLPACHQYHTRILSDEPSLMESGQAARVCCLAGAGDAEEEGYEDEYQLEDVDVLASDYIVPTPVGNFRVRPSSAVIHPPNI